VWLGDDWVPDQDQRSQRRFDLLCTHRLRLPTEDFLTSVQTPQGDTRLEDDWVPDQDQRSLEEIEEANRVEEAKNRCRCWVTGR